MKQVITLLLIILSIFVLLLIFEYFIWKSGSFHQLFFPIYYDGVDFKYCRATTYDKERIKLGTKRAAQSNLIIAGLARDNYVNLIKNLQRYDFIGSYFNNYKIVVFENDSSDGTRDLLKNHRSVDLVPCCDLGDCQCRLKYAPAVQSGQFSATRIDRMTKYRNEGLKYIKNKYSTYDYVLIVDMDTMGVIPIDGILHSLSYNKWDAIISDGRVPFPGTAGQMTWTYDAMAFMEHENDFDNIENNGFNIIRKFYRQKQMIDRSDGRLVPIYSGFNGAALYRLEALKSAKYSNLDSCEHKGLHKSMHDYGYGRIYINPFWRWYAGFQGPRDLPTMVRSIGK